MYISLELVLLNNVPFRHSFKQSIYIQEKRISKDDSDRVFKVSRSSAHEDFGPTFIGG